MLLVVVWGAALASAAPSPAAASARRASDALDARVEIVWPHGGVSVRDADQVNVTAYLFQADTRVPVPCDVIYTLRLWRAVNNEPVEAVAVGAKRIATVAGRTFPVWDFNDIDVQPARDPANKIAFYVTVDRQVTRSNIWTHGADARTYLPDPVQPSRTAGGVHSVDARIQVVWPHDESGRPQPVERATRANVTVALFDVGTTHSLNPYENMAVELYRGVNNDVLKSVGQGEKRLMTMASGLAYPVWDFNDVDVSAARDPRNKVYFRANVARYETQASIWSHGADARTYLPTPDVPEASCGGLAAPPPVVNTGEFQVTQFLIGPGSPGRLYALLRNEKWTTWRFVVSDDFGQTWQPFVGGIPPDPSFLYSLSLDYATPDALYSSGDHGVQRWNGRAWEVITAQKMSGLAIRYGDARQMWAIAFLDQADRIVHSNDGGRNWVYGRGPELTPQRLALDPRDPNTVYALAVFKGWWYRLTRASADLSLPEAQRDWGKLPMPGPMPDATAINVGGMTLDGATGALYLAVGTDEQQIPNQLWRTANPREPDTKDVRWELVHDFGPNTEADLLASGWSPQGLALYANLSIPSTCQGDFCPELPPPTLYRSLDGGRTWSPLPIPNGETGAR